jgi:phospholipid/cholesterol/gamma-HCH transport system ATP-binding protein
MRHLSEPDVTDTPREPAAVEVANARLAFGSRLVAAGLSCRFPAGKISVILGGSGVGKTVLLRMIARLQRPDWGEIWVGPQEITRLSDAEVRDLRQQIGMMFQMGALLDSMTVFDNVALPLREHTGLTEEAILERVHRQFEAVGLKDVDRLYPAEISGGMTKRVALARAMIHEPRIVLCDEPFSGLDPIAVRLIEQLIEDTNERAGVTTILTSHHIGSTMRIADHIVFLVDGIAIAGTPEELRDSRDARLRAFLDAEQIEPRSARRGARETQA